VKKSVKIYCGKKNQTTFINLQLLHRAINMSDNNLNGERPPGQPGGLPVYIRRYPVDYSGICVLIAESLEGPIKPTSVTRDMIRLCGKSFIKAVQLARNKLKVFMSNPQASNELINTGVEGVKFTIPQRLVECIGVVHVSPDITDDELLQLKSFEKSKLFQIVNPKVLNACRINKQPNQWTVTVTFSGKKLPSHVELDRCLFPVREYYYPVRQCFGCWRYGHSIKQCKSAKRCGNCSKTHEKEETYEKCEETAHCAHCQGNHASNDQNCEARKNKVRENKAKQMAENEKDHLVEWPCFSQGVVDKQVPSDQGVSVNEIEINGEIPQQVLNKKRKNSVAEEEDRDVIPEVDLSQLNVEQIIKCASEIVVGRCPKEDMIQLITTQLLNKQDGGWPPLRL
jgi:hypothetical protein